MESFLNHITNLNLLVCKRPTHFPRHDKVRITKEQRKNIIQSKSPFVPCGKVPSLWGKGSTSKDDDKNHKSLERLKLMSSISKKNGAIGRHKKWLKEVQIKRQKLKEEREDALRSIETSRALLKENEARKRAQLRDFAEREMETKSTDDEIEERSLNDLNSGRIPALCNFKNRPAWSLTEEEMKYSEESLQNEEENDLLKFTDGLNFQEYYDDMELNMLMMQVKDRIRTLEKEKKTNESKLKIISEDQAAEARSVECDMEQIFDFATDMTTENHDDDICMDVRSVAKSLMTTGGESMSSIHSKQSLGFLVAEAKRSLGTIYEDMGEIGIKVPKIVTHSDDGARLAETKSLNKLPYKNRNPAL